MRGIVFFAGRAVQTVVRAQYDLALELLQHAVTLDPNFAVAWGELGRLYWQAARAHWTNTPEISFDKAIECAE